MKNQKVRGGMSRLTLIRHSVPLIDPSVPASGWHLSTEGRERAYRLAEQLLAERLRPEVIASSVEPKAQETAKIIAERLGVPVIIVADVHEHVRSNTGFVSRDEFETKVADFFGKPDQLAFGEETAEQAHHRFSAAVRGLIERYPGKDIVIVTHGTVLSLFISRVTKLDAFAFWKQLGLPAFVVLSIPEFKVLRTG